MLACRSLGDPARDAAIDPPFDRWHAIPCPSLKASCRVSIMSLHETAASPEDSSNSVLPLAHGQPQPPPQQLHHLLSPDFRGTAAPPRPPAAAAGFEQPLAWQPQQEAILLRTLDRSRVAGGQPMHSKELAAAVVRVPAALRIRGSRRQHETGQPGAHHGEGRVHAPGLHPP